MAGRLERRDGDPIEAWRKRKGDSIPAPGHARRPPRRRRSRSSRTFLERQAIVVDARSRNRWSSAPSPEFYRWAFASMWTPGPVREQAKPRASTT